MEPRSTTIELLDSEQAGQYADEVFAVYDDVFGDRPDRQEWRVDLFDRHRAREGFRLATAWEGDELSGFAWGYIGQPGQFWTDKVKDTLPAEVTRTWLGGHFEFVELAVTPENRRHGLGRRLHDVLLDGIPARRALLSTDNADTPAVRLYSSHGWRKLGELTPEVQVMGLELPPVPLG